MAQVEQPANLDRWDNPGRPADHPHPHPLRAAGLRRHQARPSTASSRDGDGAPYLRYSNTKMKREALVPIDEELDAMIGGQQRRIRGRWPGGTPVLFPRPNAQPRRHPPAQHRHLPRQPCAAGWHAATSATSTAGPST